MICEQVLSGWVVGIVLCVFIDIYLKFKMPHMAGVRRVR